MDTNEQLRAAMEAHEHLAPDSNAVYARVRELAKGYRRRRLIMQSAGGAVLGAGLIAGAIQVPGLIPSETAPSGGVNLVQPGAAPSASPSAPITIRPSASGAPAAAGDVEEDPWDPTPKEQRALDQYFEAGYDYDDSVKLGKLWRIKDSFDIKVTAGQKLLDGKKLPIRPSGSGAGHVSVQEEKQVAAFFDKGYSYEDAVELAKIWKKGTPYDAKVLGGKKILAGQALPIKP